MALTIFRIEGNLFPSTLFALNPLQTQELAPKMRDFKF